MSREEVGRKGPSAVVLAGIEDFGREQFRKMGTTYKEPRLVLFNGQVESECGFADAAVGPFYYPGNQMVYLDPNLQKK